ncbi:MAG: MerR family transcriptional regulator [Anaerolineae bacterium]|nr:MerR family transcriptional regulator [Anaerolineae bacterium]
MATTTGTLTIKEVAAATGLSVHTLRYYERVGLIHAIDRADNSHRRYSEDDIGWINFLKKLRATGMSIHDMQTYAHLQRLGDSTLPQRVEMLKALQQQVEAHINELNEHLGLIRYKIEYYGAMIEAEALEAPA